MKIKNIQQGGETKKSSLLYKVLFTKTILLASLFLHVFGLPFQATCLTYDQSVNKLIDSSLISPVILLKIEHMKVTKR